MDYRQLGRTDLQVSSIGLGCVTFGREISPETAFGVMDHALERGITLFDTAEAYGQGRSEEVMGDWLKDRGQRDQVVLATKVAGKLTRERVLSSAEASLRRLKVETVDLFQAHNWSEGVPLDETLDALQTLVKQGKARYIGCSNYEAPQLDTALRQLDANGWPRLESVQPNYNLVTRDIEQALAPLCAEHEIGIISYSPLGAGFLTGKYRQNGPIPAGTRFDVIPGHQDIYFSDENFRKMEALRTISEAEGCSMVQLAMAWVIGQPGITSVLVGARNTGQVDQAFEAEAAGLSTQLREKLSNL